MNITEQVIQTKTDFDNVYTAGKQSMVDESKLLPTTVSGSYISLDDVSEVPHEVKCKISGIDNPSNVKITRCGRNLCGGEAFAEKLLNSGATSSIDKENRIVKLFANSNAPKFIWWDEFEVSTRYTVFLKGKNGASLYPTDTNILCYYTDDTYEMLKIFDGNNSQVCWTSAANKTVRHIKGGYNAGSSTFEYDYVGLFKGALTLEDFEPYAGQILVPEVDGTVNEMTSRSPYMNIFADTVDVNIEATYNKSWGMKEASDRFCNALVQEVIYHSISFERLTLSKENIKSIINALSPTVTDQTITLKQSAKEFFTDEEWQELISTKPTWSFLLL